MSRNFRQLELLCDHNQMESNTRSEPPDITSIIASFEENLNPVNLFLRTESSSTKYRDIYDIQMQLNILEDNLDEMEKWVYVNSTPICFPFTKIDLDYCVSKISRIQNKFAKLNKAFAKTISAYKSRKRFDPTVHYKYNVKCSCCQENFPLNNRANFDVFEEHSHVAAVLARGNALKQQQATAGQIIPPRDNKNVTDNNKSCENNLNNGIQIEGQIAREIVRKHLLERNIQNNVPYVLCKYSKPIMKQLYLPYVINMASTYENNYDFYTIQADTSLAKCYYCLLCKRNLRKRDLEHHLISHGHMKKIQTPKHIKLMIHYHETFSKFPEELQVFQTVIKPCNIKDNNMVYFECEICKTKFESGAILEHLRTSEVHKKKYRNFKYYKFYKEMAEILEEMYKTVRSSSSTSSSLASSDRKKKSIKQRQQQQQSSNCSSESIVFDENASTSSKSSRQNTQDNNLDTKTSAATAKRETSTSAKDTNNAKQDKKIKEKHTIILSVKESPSKNWFDGIESRYLWELIYVKFENDMCVCNLCKIVFEKNCNAFKTHLLTDKHRELTIDKPKRKLAYYCDLCVKYYASDKKWADHYKMMEHIERQEVIRKGKKPNGDTYKEYECVECNLIFYGNKVSWLKHERGAFGTKKRKKLRVIKLNDKIEALLKNEVLFDKDIEKLSKESEDVLKSSHISDQCCRAIEEALVGGFGEQVRAYPFGSRISGLGNLVSDLDVFVDTGMMYDGLYNQDNESQTQFVRITAKTLRKHKDFQDICQIPTARTPIVQVFHKKTGLDCDLSFRHGLSVENTEFLRLCIDIQPKLKQLILFLKKWLYGNKLREKITTYAISMMAIYFMQVGQFLPTITAIRAIDPIKSNVIAGWETFCVRKPLSELNKFYPYCPFSVRYLVYEFFNFYLKFNYQKEVICPLNGLAIPKTDFAFANGKKLPPEMSAYVRKINENPKNEFFKITQYMCIQDPFDLSHNLTKACSAEVQTRFLTLCKQSMIAMSPVKWGEQSSIWANKIQAELPPFMQQTNIDDQETTTMAAATAVSKQECDEECEDDDDEDGDEEEDDGDEDDDDDDEEDDDEMEEEDEDKSDDEESDDDDD